MGVTDDHVIIIFLKILKYVKKKKEKKQLIEQVFLAAGDRCIIMPYLLRYTYQRI